MSSAQFKLMQQTKHGAHIGSHFLEFRVLPMNLVGPINLFFSFTPDLKFHGILVGRKSGSKMVFSAVYWWKNSYVPNIKDF